MATKTYNDMDQSYAPDDPENPYNDPTSPYYIPPETAPAPETDGGTSTPDDSNTAPSPWDTAPTDGNWQAWFLRNIQGTTPSSASLLALEAQLAKHGIKIVKNAQGIAGKIQLPDGGIVDVGRAFSGSDPSQMSWQWLTDAGSVAPDGTPLEIDPSYLTPFDEKFLTPERGELPDDFTYDDFQAPADFSYEAFRAPDAKALLDDPGYQFRVDQGRGMLETSAAAKGLLNSGGTLKDLVEFGQGLGSQEYDNAWNRGRSMWEGNRQNALSSWDANYRKDLESYNTNRDNAVGNFGINYGLSSDAYNRAWNEYGQRRELHYSNQNNAWKKILEAAQLGAGASAS